MTVKDKIVLVTGASQGIGRTTALAFLDEGARVVLVARRADKLGPTPCARTAEARQSQRG